MQPISKPLIVASKTHGVKVDAGVVAASFRNEIKVKVQKLKDSGLEAPLLVGLLANNDPAARKYAEWTGRACQADGLRYELRIVEDPIDVERVLLDSNEDPRVHGIIVYYPIFGQEESFSGASQDDYLRDSVSYKCDVEGLCHLYRTNLYRNVRYLDTHAELYFGGGSGSSGNGIIRRGGVAEPPKCLLPCTALSVVKLLEECPGCYDAQKPIGKRMEGRVVTVINRSEIVGRPLAAMLSNDGADVYSIDIESIYLFRSGRLHKCGEDVSPEICVRKSSIVVTGVPTKSYRLPTEWIQENSTVVNVASFKNVDEDSLLKVPGVVYIPQVGKVTVAMLERNLMRLYENFHNPESKKQLAAATEMLGASTTTSTTSVYLQAYTAVAVTALLVAILARK